ncbi:hypothetical protein NC651_039018 [Populus alba x Populus x berolinensis]|nr:hypothetical protein NC651_039018 [Populus alba x Populus x berolinensis]
MLAAVSNKVIVRFDLDELGFLNDYNVLEASRNFNDNSLESERFRKGNAGTNNAIAVVVTRMASFPVVLKGTDGPGPRSRWLTQN